MKINSLLVEFDTKLEKLVTAQTMKNKADMAVTFYIHNICWRYPMFGLYGSGKFRNLIEIYYGFNDSADFVLCLHMFSQVHNNTVILW